MRLIRNVSGISKLVLMILLVIAFVTGGLLSYLWTMGFYSPYEFRLPSSVSVTIEKIEFLPQNTSFFNLTLLTPSYSPSKATINKVTVLTDDKVFSNIETQPSMPQELEAGVSQTLKCFWNWADYTGQTVTVVVSIDNGSGPNIQATTPYVGLSITAYVNSSISVHRFNITIQNAETSATHVNITQLTINEEIIPPQNITINGETVSFPRPLNPGESVFFTCAWNWTDYQGREVTIDVRTIQGYSASLKQLALPKPVTLEITDIIFDPSNTSRFSVTVCNNETSPAFVSVNKIFLTMENGTTVEDLEVNPPLTSPYVLQPNTSEIFDVVWNWTYYRNQSVTVTAYTIQGFVSSPKTAVTPPSVILEITKLDFNLTSLEYFNVTVQNSPYSISTVNITRILFGTNDTQINPPYLWLEPGATAVFNCTWSWRAYSGMNVTITVYTAEGFKAYYTLEIPSVKLEITDAPVFNSTLGIRYFNVSVYNSHLSLRNVTISRISVTLENGTVYEIDSTLVYPLLPYEIYVNTTVTFTCPWNWESYKGMNVTITVYTLEGYEASYVCKVPETP